MEINLNEDQRLLNYMEIAKQLICYGYDPSPIYDAIYEIIQDDLGKIILKKHDITRSERTDITASTEHSISGGNGADRQFPKPNSTPTSSPKNSRKKNGRDERSI